MIKNLIKIANLLDSRGLVKEADKLDLIIRKMSSSKSSIGYGDDVSFEDMHDLNLRPDVYQFVNQDDVSQDDYDANIESDTTEYTGTPESNLISRMFAVNKLYEMSDKEFEDLAKKFPRTMSIMFGSNSLTPSSRVKKRFNQ